MNKLAKLWKNKGSSPGAPKVNKRGVYTGRVNSMEYYMLLGGKQCLEMLVSSIRRGEKFEDVVMEMGKVYDEQIRIARNG